METFSDVRLGICDWIQRFTESQVVIRAGVYLLGPMNAGNLFPVKTIVQMLTQHHGRMYCIDYTFHKYKSRSVIGSVESATSLTYFDTKDHLMSELAVWKERRSPWFVEEPAAAFKVYADRQSETANSLGWHFLDQYLRLHGILETNSKQQELGAVFESFFYRLGSFLDMVLRARNESLKNIASLL